MFQKISSKMKQWKKKFGIIVQVLVISFNRYADLILINSQKISRWGILKGIILKYKVVYQKFRNFGTHQFKNLIWPQQWWNSDSILSKAVWKPSSNPMTFDISCTIHIYGFISGAGLYPCLALLNHSCDPSFMRCNKGNEVICVASKVTILRL